MNPDSPKRTKLDELYAEVEAAAKIVDDAANSKAELAVTRAETEAEKKQLAELHDRLKTLTADYDQRVRDYDEEIVGMRGSIVELQHELNELDSKNAAVLQLSAEAEEHLKNINIAISDAQTIRYQLEHDNNEMALRHEQFKRNWQALELELTGKIDILEVRLAALGDASKVNLETIATQQKTMADAAAAHKQTMKQYDDEIAVLNVEVANKRAAVATFDAAMDKRRRDTEAGEESIRLKQEALRQEASDLKMARHKFESDKAIYGV